MSAFAVAAFHDETLALGAGRVDAVVWVRPAGLGEDGADVSLRVWTPRGASVVVLREVAPATGDLRAGAVRVDERTSEFPAGRWTDCAREYELAVVLEPRGDGVRILAARVEVVAGGEVAGCASIAVTWTADDALLNSGDDAGGRPDDAELPTGRSPQPRHTAAEHGHAGEPCPGCGEQTAQGDNFCEGCGRALDAA
ncbi:MAG: hypothetical protein QOJ89_2895 [bacterium]|jgi:hypothetical protein